MRDSKARRMAKKAMALSSLDFGEITLPSDFPALPCKLYRDFDRIVKHNMSFTSYKSGTAIYVDSTGNDTTGDGSSANPYRTIQKAITTAIAGADSSYCIRARTYRFNRDQVFPVSASSVISGKTLAIIPDDPTKRIMLTTHQSGLAWSQDGTNTFKATRSNVYAVYDLRNVDVYGVPIPLANKRTLADCQATVNSWYTDNVSVWVHTSDGVAPNDTNFIVNINLDNTIKLLNGSKFYTENCDFYEGRANHGLSVVGDPATMSGEFCGNNCKFVGGYLRDDGSVAGNAFSGQDLYRTFIFNSNAAYSGRDGFNHHFSGVPTANARNYLVFEYGLTSYNHGMYDTNHNNNCFTTHEGANILRVNNTGYDSTGPTLADVNGTYSIIIDCNMRGSDPAGSYYFDNESATTLGKAILINCGSKNDTYDINGSTGFSVLLSNFKGGRKIKDGMIITYS